jgi:transcription elongation factor GreA
MSNKNTFNLTADGYAKVEEELNKLRNEDRPRIIEAIKDARAQGDLSENAEYSSAREEQAKVESRIKELEYMLDHAEISKAPKNKVGIGSVVTIQYDDGDEDVYTIVGATEVDLDENKISNESPIGKALFGAKVDDEVSVEAPNGSYTVKIVSIN